MRMFRNAVKACRELSEDWLNWNWEVLIFFPKQCANEKERDRKDGQEPKERR